MTESRSAGLLSWFWVLDGLFHQDTVPLGVCPWFNMIWLKNDRFFFPRQATFFFPTRVSRDIIF